jgi:hypothetical protein
VGTHLDQRTIDILRSTAAVENRKASQIQAVALKTLLSLSPGARRAFFAIDGIANERERDFAAKTIGRAALTAYERILDARHRSEHHPESNAELDTEEAIEAEAVRLCRS